MLVPLDSVVGSGYNAGLTATQIVQQPDAEAGAGYTSPSGLPIGGLKVGYDVDYHRTATDASSRYLAGPPALRAGSESSYVPKDRRANYLTELDLARSGGANLGSLTEGQGSALALGAVGLLLYAFLRR